MTRPTKAAKVATAAKPKDSKAEKGETAREKFLRLAPARAEAALKKISLLGNLAGHGYDYQPAEGKQIVGALQDAVNDVERKFSKAKSSKKGQGFTFR